MTPSRLRHLAVPLLCILAIAPAYGELSIEDQYPRPPSMVIMAIIDHPDPIGSAAWVLVRPELVNTALNPDGFDRGDGRPDVGWHRGESRPVVVWSYNTGIDHDIAMSEWEGSSWSPMRFLTADLANELDPRVSVEDDGTIHVVWWEEGQPDRVWHSKRHPAQSAWGTPVLVSELDQSARRPSVIVHDGVLIVAYERTSALNDTHREIVMARLVDGDNGFTREVVATTTRTARLDPILHHRPGLLWVDWKHDAGQFGYAVASSSIVWAPNATVAWEADWTWIGAEEARRHIANTLGADLTGPDPN